MRILVAGGAGYIGSVLVPLLRGHGYDVTVVDNCWFGNALPEDVVVRKLDLFELREEDLAGHEQVIFLGGLSNDPMAEFSPAQNFVMNGALPSYLAYTAKRAGVGRFIYACSCSVYGRAAGEPCDENSPPVCGYPYGISKLQGEHGVMQLRDDGFSVVSLRQGTVNGYSPRMRFDLVVNTMYRHAVADGRLTVNNPAVWRPIVDVRDAAAAFLLAARADPGVGGVFNIAYDNFTVGRIGDMVKEEVELLTGRKVRIETFARRDCRDYRVACRKARDVLGFRPRHGVPEIVRSLHERRDEYGDFSDERFYNIAVFRRLARRAPGAE